MAYRIIEFERGGCVGAVEIGSYDSAYRAMRFMRAEFERRGPGSLNWYLLDQQGQVLAAPEDVLEANVA